MQRIENDELRIQAINNQFNRIQFEDEFLTGCALRKNSQTNELEGVKANLFFYTNKLIVGFKRIEKLKAEEIERATKLPVIVCFKSNFSKINQIKILIINISI